METKYLYPGDDLTGPNIVRTAVFVNEQKFSAENEFDDIDQISHHVVVYLDGKPVATGRFFPTENIEGQYTVGRVAVVKEYRKTGLGKLIMEAVEKKAREIGVESLYLGAQDHACGFYEKLGYKINGDQYMDEHMVHFPMIKILL